MIAALAGFGAFGGIGAVIVLFCCAASWAEDHWYDAEGRLLWPRTQKGRNGAHTVPALRWSPSPIAGNYSARRPHCNSRRHQLSARG